MASLRTLLSWSRIGRLIRLLCRLCLYDHLLELIYRLGNRWPEHKVDVARIDSVVEAAEAPEPWRDDPIYLLQPISLGGHYSRNDEPARVRDLEVTLHAALSNSEAVAHHDSHCVSENLLRGGGRSWFVVRPTIYFPRPFHPILISFVLPLSSYFSEEYLRGACEAFA